MRFARAVPKVGALPELRTYDCKACGVAVTEADEPAIYDTYNEPTGRETPDPGQ